MTTSQAHIAWRPALGAALALALAAVCADTMQASARFTTAPAATSTGAVAPSAAPSLAPAHGTPSRYGWPVKPFRAQHPVRGFFGDPRISNQRQTRQFHFGVDVSARSGTAVYATLTGRVWIHPLHPHTIGIVGASGVEFSYWHVVPTVGTGEHAVAYRTMIGRVEAPYGHVHFSESHHGRYVNPLRPGAMGPFVDDTTPFVTRVTVEQGGRRLQSSGARGAFDLITEVGEETPIAVPRPWFGLPVMPAVVRWRLVTETGRTVRDWGAVVDFRETIPPASEFDRVWAPGTTQNHVRSPGHYRLYLARGLDLDAGGYVVEVAVRDTRGNRSSSRFMLVVRAG